MDSDQGHTDYLVPNQAAVKAKDNDRFIESKKLWATAIKTESFYTPMTSSLNIRTNDHPEAPQGRCERKSEHSQPEYQPAQFTHI